VNHGIEWNTAEVEHGELRVKLTPDPDFAFMESFDIVLIEGSEPADKSWDDVMIAQGRVVVSGVKTGSVAALRAYLDDVVRQANRLAEPERERLAREHEADERRQRELKAAAEASERSDEQLAEEFRRRG
jgi:hypothetical protein